jgi:hypothetical protein
MYKVKGLSKFNPGILRRYFEVQEKFTCFTVLIVLIITTQYQQTSGESIDRLLKKSLFILTVYCLSDPVLHVSYYSIRMKPASTTYVAPATKCCYHADYSIDYLYLSELDKRSLSKRLFKSRLPAATEKF